MARPHLLVRRPGLRRRALPLDAAQVDRQREEGVQGPARRGGDLRGVHAALPGRVGRAARALVPLVVPSAMIFDDHDVQDDWNTSLSYLRDRRKEDWWNHKISSALASYWIYQHAGNLSPGGAARRPDVVAASSRPARRATRATSGPVRALRPAGRPRARDRALELLPRHRRTRSSIVMDSRGARLLDPDDRRMVEPRGVELDRRRGHGGHRPPLPGHVPALAHGPRPARPRGAGTRPWPRARGSPLAEKLIGEKTRRAADLEHWAAFGKSFRELAELVRAVGAGERGSAPATIVALSGDVHHAYLMEAAYPDDAGVRSRGLAGRVLADAQPPLQAGAPDVPPPAHPAGGGAGPRAAQARRASPSRRCAGGRSPARRSTTSWPRSRSTARGSTWRSRRPSATRSSCRASRPGSSAGSTPATARTRPRPRGHAPGRARVASG